MSDGIDKVNEAFASAGLEKPELLYVERQALRQGHGQDVVRIVQRRATWGLWGSFLASLLYVLQGLFGGGGLRLASLASLAIGATWMVSTALLYRRTTKACRELNLSTSGPDLAEVGTSEAVPEQPDATPDLTWVVMNTFVEQGLAFPDIHFAERRALVAGRLDNFLALYRKRRNTALAVVTVVAFLQLGLALVVVSAGDATFMKSGAAAFVGFGLLWLVMGSVGLMRFRRVYRALETLEVGPGS